MEPEVSTLEMWEQQEELKEYLDSSTVRQHIHNDGLGTQDGAKLVHAHAFADVPHLHILRALCQLPECAGCLPHNVHGSGFNWKGDDN